MHRSRIDYKKIISAAELPPAALQAVEVLTGLDHMGSNLLQSTPIFTSHLLRKPPMGTSKCARDSALQTETS
jgi:hypothetical protein